MQRLGAAYPWNAHVDGDQHVDLEQAVDARECRVRVCAVELAEIHFKPLADLQLLARQHRGDEGQARRGEVKQVEQEHVAARCHL